MSQRLRGTAILTSVRSRHEHHDGPIVLTLARKDSEGNISTVVLTGHWDEAQNPTDEAGADPKGKRRSKDYDATRRTWSTERLTGRAPGV